MPRDASTLDKLRTDCERRIEKVVAEIVVARANVDFEMILVQHATANFERAKGKLTRLQAELKAYQNQITST